MELGDTRLIEQRRLIMPAIHRLRRLAVTLCGVSRGSTLWAPSCSSSNAFANRRPQPSFCLPLRSYLFMLAKPPARTDPALPNRTHLALIDLLFGNLSPSAGRNILTGVRNGSNVWLL